MRIGSNTFDRTTVRGGAPGRRGALSVELVLILPILLIVVLAVVQFSLLLLSGQAVSAAASVGAREATLPGATHQTVAAAVARAVQGWRFAPELDDVVIYINDQPESFVPLTQAMTGDFVAVTVSVDSTAAVPDMLKFIGLSIDSHKLKSTFVMRKE